MAKELIAVEKAALAPSQLTPEQYGQLAEVPAQLEWLANLTNPKTRRAYGNDVSGLSAFTGLRGPAALRTVTRARVIASRKHLETCV